jgi:sterol 14-demethylase
MLRSGAHEINSQFGDIFAFELFGRDCVFMGGTEAQTAFYESADEVLSAAEAYKFTIPAFGPGVIYDASVEKFSEERTYMHLIYSFCCWFPL